MAVNRNYEYSEENKLLYNIDDYSVNSGLSIDFVDGSATLRNINTNPKSNNFFGDGKLGSQTYVGEKMISPTCCYFQNLIIDDDLYGTHLQGVFAETGTFNIGDELILYKKFCSDKDLYDEVGKWDIVKVTNIIVDGDGINRYVIDREPNNDYTGDNTVNIATVVLQFQNLTIGDTMFLQAQDSGDNRKYQSNNPRDLVRHPDKEVWKNRMLGNPRGILFIKVKDKFEMLDNSRLQNHVGTWGGLTYKNRTDYELDDTEYRHDYYIPACGFLPSPSDGYSNNNDKLKASMLCDYAGYHQSGGPSFYAEGDRHKDVLYTSKQIPSDYLGDDGDLDKMFMGMPGSCSDYSDYWTYGADGGGILIIQARETILNDNVFITVASVNRCESSDNQRKAGAGAGGHLILKTPSISVTSDNAFVSTIKDEISQTYSDWTEDKFKEYGARNVGLTVLEFESIKFKDEDPVYFQDVIDNFDDYKRKIIDDYNYLETAPKDDDGKNIMNADNLYRENDYPEIIDQEQCIVQSPTTSMAEYETGSFFRVYTKGIHNIDTSIWNQLNEFDINTHIPQDTDIRFIFSRDGGENWFKINTDDSTASGVNLDDVSSGNTVAEISEFKDTLALTSIFLGNSESKTIDVCVGLKTSKSFKSPSINNIHLTYEGVAVPNAPIRILPYHEDEFDSDEVDFVWMQPLQDLGSLQNRLEISPTASFEPNTDILDIKLSNYSNTNSEIHLPYTAELVDNMTNTAVDLLLPYIVSKGVNTYDTMYETTSSVDYDIENNTLKYLGDTWCIRGNTIQIGEADIVVPNLDIDGDAPLLSYVDDDMTIAYRLSGYENTDDYNDKKNNIDFSYIDGVDTISNSYLGVVSKFSGSSRIFGTINNSDKQNHILTSINTEKTIHIKFNISAISDYAPLFNIMLNEAGTAMVDLRIYKDRVYLNGVNAYYRTDSYGLELKDIMLSIEQNITIVCHSDNSASVYLNGFLVIEKCIYNMHTAYIDDEDDDDSNDNTDDIGVCLGHKNKTNTGSGFFGSIHEFIVYDSILDSDEIMEISKTPNYHLRYDIKNKEYNLVQLPTNNNELISIANAEMWRENFGNDNRNISHYSDLALSNFNNNGYSSNNDTLLLGKYYPQKYARDNFTGVYNDKHTINGYNTWLDYSYIPNINIFTYKTNNTIEQNYTRSFVSQYKVGRINKQDVTTKLEFIYTHQNIDMYDGTATKLGLTYSNASNGDLARNYYVDIVHNGNYTYDMKIYLGYGSEINIRLNEFKPEHRYTITIQPVDGSFQDNTLIRLYSKTNSAYNLNPIMYSSKESHGYNDSNIGFVNKEYSDMKAVNDDGDYTDVGFHISDYRGEFQVIGITCSDSSSSVVRTSGYVDSYFIEKRLVAGLTYNIIRLDVVSEIRSSLVHVKHVISFDNGNSWNAYDTTDMKWKVLENLAMDTLDTDGMTDAALYAVTDSIAIEGGFNNENDTILRSYLFTDNNMLSPKIRGYKILTNGPRIIDSWIEPGSYYRSKYQWYYLNDGSWNPYLEINTSDDSDQSWNSMGTGIPSPTQFIDGNGSKPSTNLLKTYAYVKVDCLPKGKWYWRVSAYNGLKR